MDINSWFFVPVKADDSIVWKIIFSKKGGDLGVINELLHVLKVFFVILGPYDLVKLAWAPPFPPPFFENCLSQKYEAWAISRTKNHPFRFSGCWDWSTNISCKKTSIFLHEALIFEIWKSWKWAIFSRFWGSFLLRTLY